MRRLLALALALGGCFSTGGDPEEEGRPDAGDVDATAPDAALVPLPRDGAPPPDATPSTDAYLAGPPDRSIADITGAYLLAVAPFGDPTQPLLSRADVNAQVGSDDGGPFSMVLFPLDSSTREVMRDARIPAEGTLDGGLVEPGPAPDFAVTIDLGRVIIPGRANALSGSEIEGTLRLLGHTTLDREPCGDVEGTTSRPASFDLSGSTFGTIWIADDTQGDDADVSAAAEAPSTACRPPG